MKVLHVAAGVSWKYGGVTQTLLALCEWLARQPGITVELASTDADGPNDRLRETDFAHHGFPVRLFKRDWSERWKYSRGLDAYLAAHVRDFDLVHVHGVWTYASTAVRRAAVAAGVPYVLMPQGMLSEYSWSRSSKTKAIYWALLEKTNVQRAALVYLTGRQEAIEYDRLGLATPRLVFPQGVAEAAVAVPRVETAPWVRLGVPDDGRPVVLFLSRIHPKKGIVDFLLPAFQKLQTDCKLVIAGGADPLFPSHLDAVKAQIAAAGLARRVFLTGAIEPDDRWGVFDHAQVFCLPSHQENFGIVTAEAMARALPVVVSRPVDASEHVEAARAGFVTPLDVDLIAGAIDAVLADTAAAQAMGGRGRAYVQEHLVWSALAPRVAAMYADVLAQRRA